MISVTDHGMHVSVKHFSGIETRFEEWWGVRDVSSSSESSPALGPDRPAVGRKYSPLSEPGISAEDSRFKKL